MLALSRIYPGASPSSHKTKPWTRLGDPVLVKIIEHIFEKLGQQHRHVDSSREQHGCSYKTSVSSRPSISQHSPARRPSSRLSMLLSDERFCRLCALCIGQASHFLAFILLFLTFHTISQSPLNVLMLARKLGMIWTAPLSVWCRPRSNTVLIQRLPSCLQLRRRSRHRFHPPWPS